MPSAELGRHNRDRSICLICKIKIRPEEHIGTCSVCHQKYHSQHLRMLILTKPRCLRCFTFLDGKKIFLDMKKFPARTRVQSQRTSQRQRSTAGLPSTSNNGSGENEKAEIFQVLSMVTLVLSLLAPIMKNHNQPIMIFENMLLAIGWLSVAYFLMGALVMLKSEDTRKFQKATFGVNFSFLFLIIATVFLKRNLNGDIYTLSPSFTYEFGVGFWLVISSCIMSLAAEYIKTKT